jgi:toluene monooxygenase system ferredoxin subunit
MSESEGRGVACVAVRWEDAADLGELWEGDVLDVEVAGEHVLLVRLPGGEVRAYQGLCPHQKMLLADGDFDADSGVLVCMGHLWEFDLRAGVSINPAGCPLYTYSVEVAGDRVKVGIPQDGLRHCNRGQGTRTPGMRGRHS